MFKTPRGLRFSTVLEYILCGCVAFAAARCGWQRDSTLGLSVPDDADTPSSGDADPGWGPDSGGDSNDDIASTDEVTGNAYCEAVTEWDSTWTTLENEVLTLVNERRAAGADCGGAGSFGPAEPLTMNAALRCAARSHSMDMGTRGYFDHYTPEGLGPGERLEQAGYEASTWGENIAWGYAAPADVVSGWMTSPGHCANIMQAQFTETGVGYYEGSLWTLTFGRP